MNFFSRLLLRKKKLWFSSFLQNNKLFFILWFSFWMNGGLSKIQCFYENKFFFSQPHPSSLCYWSLYRWTVKGLAYANDSNTISICIFQILPCVCMFLYCTYVCRQRAPNSRWINHVCIHLDSFVNIVGKRFEVWHAFDRNVWMRLSIMLRRIEIVSHLLESAKDISHWTMTIQRGQCNLISSFFFF